ncbi:MAG: amino acid permease [Pseudomonadota bacterium]
MDLDKNGRDKFSMPTAASIVVANMIGTGVFTSLGFQLLDIQSAPVILLLWVVGGVLALCGALCYSELGAALPRSGGEYNFLTEIYHPAAGFISGWISTTIGFAAPTALAAITAATYLSAVWPHVSTTLVAVVLVTVVGLAHLGSRTGSARFQLFFTGLKLLLILLFVVLAWWSAPELQTVRWLFSGEDVGLVTSGAFAIALIYVNYAYTGWNAATYLAGEMHQPNRTLPKVLLVGTGLVMLVYVLLHVMFLSVAPMTAMAGQLEIGYVVADFAFGSAGAGAVGLMLALLLVSTVSAMVLAGPRALQVIGQDFAVLGFLSRENRHGVPWVAIVFQTGMTLLLVITSTFDAILVFASFTMAFNTLMAVLGVAVLRKRRPDIDRPFRVPWYPIPLLIYSGITLWTLVFVLWERPQEAGFGVGLIVLGWLFYRVARARVPAHSELS